MSRRFRHRFGHFQLLLSAVALVSQMALGSIVPLGNSARQQLAAFAAASAFCQGSNHAGRHDPASHRHRPGDPALCPLSIALAMPAVILSRAPLLPASNEAVLLLRSRDRPPGRGPPAATARVGVPRAPPPLTA